MTLHPDDLQAIRDSVERDFGADAAIATWKLRDWIWSGADVVLTFTEEDDQVARLSAFDCPVVFVPKLLGHSPRRGWRDSDGFHEYEIAA